MRSWAATLVTFPLRAGGWLVACWAAASCSGAHEPTQALPTPPRSSVAPTVNVPALLGASIDGLRQKLGPPQALPANYSDPITAFFTANPASKIDSVTAFRSGGLTVVANYDASTRRVWDLVVLGRHEDSLMARATLRASARNYLIMPVFFVDKPSRLMGLRIVNTAHN